MTTPPQKNEQPVKKAASVSRGKSKTAVEPTDAVKAPAAKKAAAPKAATVKKTAKPKAAAGKKNESRAGTPKTEPIPELTPEQRRLYVEVAAYYIAERRGFHGGSEIDDWLQAEAEIDRLLREGILKP